MTNTAESAAGTADAPMKRRRRRSATAHRPRWLRQAPRQASAQEVTARSRALMILAVLAGQKTVSEAIEEAKMPRALYYQLETRALEGMIRALHPLVQSAMSETRELRLARRRIQALSAQVELLTQRRRSAERLLRMVIKSTPAARTARQGGGPRKSLSTPMTPGGDLP
jgi:hypothetical protein